MVSRVAAAWRDLFDSFRPPSGEIIDIKHERRKPASSDGGNQPAIGCGEASAGTFGAGQVEAIGCFSMTAMAMARPISESAL